MQFKARMKSLLVYTISALLAICPVFGCATTETTSSWVGVGDWQRPGRVVAVREIDHRIEGNPAGGALLGALIGGILFHGRGPATMYGAATGAVVGAAASSGSAETRTFQVHVHFDDGDDGVFAFRDGSPFRPGDPVVLTPHGLMPR